MDDLGVPLFQETSKWISWDILGHGDQMRSGHQQQSGSNRDTTAATDWGVQSGPWDAAYHDDPWCTNGNYHFLPWCTDVPCIQHWQFELPCFVGFSWIYRSLGMISPANHRVATGTRSNRIPSGRLWSCEADSKCAGLRRQHAQSMLISSSFIISRALNVNLNDIIHDFNIF